MSVCSVVFVESDVLDRPSFPEETIDYMNQHAAKKNTCGHEKCNKFCSDTSFNKTNFKNTFVVNVSVGNCFNGRRDYVVAMETVLQRWRHHSLGLSETRCFCIIFANNKLQT